MESANSFKAAGSKTFAAEKDWGRFGNLNFLNFGIGVGNFFRIGRWIADEGSPSVALAKEGAGSKSCITGAAGKAGSVVEAAVPIAAQLKNPKTGW